MPDGKKGAHNGVANADTIIQDTEETDAEDEDNSSEVRTEFQITNSLTLIMQLKRLSFIKQTKY